MRSTLVRFAGLVLLSAAMAALAAPGCTAALFLNQTTELTGNVSIVFINDTPFRASYTFGVFNDLERDPPGQVTFAQNRLAAGATTAATGQSCSRNMAVGTDKLIQRVIDTNADQSQTGFDADAFNAVVNFSDAPAGSDLEAAPTAGTALGLDKLVGVDFSCGDQLIFTFREDPDAVGGFRIDFQVIHDADDTN